MKKGLWLTAAGVMFLYISILNPQSVLGQTPPTKTPALLVKGKQIYEEKCTICHGKQGNGQTAAAQVLKPPPRDFTQPWKNWAVSLGNPVKIFQVIKEGIPNTAMVKADLPDEDVWAVVYAIMEFNRSGG
jgi:cytochrome c